MKTQRNIRLGVCALIAAASMFGGYSPAAENIGTVSQPLVGGTLVSEAQQEEFGLLTLNGSCSASLLSNDWAITAAHCIDLTDDQGNAMPDPRRPGQNVLEPLGPMRLTANWKTTQEKKVTRVETFWPYDVAIIKVDSPFQVNGKTTGYSRLIFQDGQFPYFGDPVGADLLVFGRGINRFATGAGDAAIASQSDGQYRMGRAKSTSQEAHLYWYPSQGGQMIAGGDSGGPSFAKVLGGYALVGVHALTIPEYIEGKPKTGWDWISATPKAADAPIAPVWDRISQMMIPPPVWQPWFRVTDGGGSKAPITALQPRPGHIDLFVTDNDGGIYSTYHEQAGGWRKWFRIGDLKVPTQSPITALATRPGHIDLFVIGSDNGVYSTFHEAQGGWRPWFKIGFVGVGARSAVAAVQSRPGHLDLFVVGTDNKIYSTYHDGTPWKDWFPIGEMRAPVGSSITALSPVTGHIDLFVSGTEGGVYTAIHPNGGNWSAWSRIGDVEMKPGSPITALYTRPDHLDLFVVDKDRRIFSIFRGKGAPDFPARWQDWFRVTNMAAVAGTRIAALATREGHLDLFAVGTDGGVRGTYHEAQGNWRPWFRIPDVFSTPGAQVTALATRPDHIDLFVSGPDSGVYSTSHSR